MKKPRMPQCRNCGGTDGPFQSKNQCRKCATARVLRRYHKRWPMASDDLYVLRCPGHYGTWKVGRSHCLARRLLEFNRHVVCPYELEQVYIGCGKLETRLHRAISIHRVMGSMSREFFDCQLQIILDAADSLVAQQARSSESWDRNA